MRHRLTVSEVVGLLFYKDKDILGKPEPFNFALTEGKRIHERLGFNDPQQFRRYIFDAETETWWLIIGCPDKIDQKNGAVKELKTYFTAKMPEATQNAGSLQAMIYCWLTGLSKWELWGYSSYHNKLSKIAEGNADDQLVFQTIIKAIRLKRLLRDFVKTYRQAQGGGQNEEENE